MFELLEQFLALLYEVKECLCDTSHGGPHAAGFACDQNVQFLHLA